MKLFIKGVGEVDVTDRDFLAQGGEGKIYAKGGTVYKVYHDPLKMVPPSKIQELAVLTKDNILKPERVLQDKKDKPVGYTMRHIPNCHQLPRLFTKAFRQRESITPEMIARLVKNMQETVQYIHSHDILVVDLNEFNFLVSPDFKEMYFIDVDSYKTPSFPPTALMESVRDRHAKHNEFTELTDWFAFAIVTFQMFIGIHPFKGKHKTVHYADDAEKTLDERMKKNLSVMDADVTIPKVCYPFDNIPDEYRRWYWEIFARGARSLPPTGALSKTYAAVKISPVQSTQKLKIVEILQLPMGSVILGCYFSHGNEVIIAKDKVYIDRRPLDWAKGGVATFTPKLNRPIICAVSGGTANLYDATRQSQLGFKCYASNVMSYNNRTYLMSAGSIFELQFVESNTTCIPAIKQVAQVMEQATKLYEGVAIQDLLGSCFVSLFPESDHHVGLRIKELDGVRIIDAKYDSGVLMVVIAHKDGKYDRYIFRFDKDWSYDIRIVKDIVYSGINFVTLESGVCACITEDEHLELFPNRINSTNLSRVQDNAIDSNMTLYKNGAMVLFARDNRLYHISTRK